MIRNPAKTRRVPGRRGTRIQSGTRPLAIVLSLRRKLVELERQPGGENAEKIRRYKLTLGKIAARVSMKYDPDITRDPVPAPPPRKRGGPNK